MRSLFLLFLALLLVVPVTGWDVAPVHAEEPDVEPGEDLGDQDIPFHEQVNEAMAELERGELARSVIMFD